MIIPDEFGKCVKCHKNLIMEKVINNEIKRVLTPDYSQIQLLLSDGSNMRVVMCLRCQDTYIEKDNKDIMESVIAGWEKELKELPHWSENKKDDYMKKYSQLKINNKVKEYSYGISDKTKHI